MYYKAHFVAGWMDIDAEAETPNGLIDRLNYFQDIRCLLMQGLYMGFATDEDCQELRRLENFYEKYLRRELVEDDIRNFHYMLSLGPLDCTKFEVLDDETEPD